MTSAFVFSNSYATRSKLNRLIGYNGENIQSSKMIHCLCRNLELCTYLLDVCQNEPGHYIIWLHVVSTQSKQCMRKLGRIHTGSGSVPDSSEPYASGRLRVGFAFTLQTTDPPRTVRAHFPVYTLCLLRDRL